MPTDKLTSELAAAALPLALSTIIPLDTGAAELQRTTLAAIRGPGSIDVQQFTANGTWTKPPGAKFVQVFLLSGGQGGGSGRQGAAGTQRTGGNGGQGGQLVLLTTAAAALGATEVVTFGANTGEGGASVTSPDTSGNAGQLGRSVAFAGFVVGTYPAAGGAGGTNINSSQSGNGTSVIDGMTQGPPTFGAGSITGATTNAGIGVGIFPGSGAAGATINAANSVLGGGLQKVANIQVLGTPPTAALVNATEGQPGPEGKTFGAICALHGVAIGTGGAGGGAGNTMAAGAGGNGGPAGSYGGGGGGGGASTNGFASGKGGDGGPAIAIIISY